MHKKDELPLEFPCSLFSKDLKEFLRVHISMESTYHHFTFGYQFLAIATELFINLTANVLVGDGDVLWYVCLCFWWSLEAYV